MFVLNWESPSRVAAAALLAGCPLSNAFAQEPGPAIATGESHVIQSRVMQEQRRVLVTLPESYQRTTVGYPALFVLDGSSHILHATSTTRFLAAARNRIPEMIVVAVPNTNRNRDLTPGAGAGRFERFFAEELLPWVDSAYRTVPERIILGHSLGGSFVTHALLNRPDLFDVYIAASAPLWRYDSLARDVRAGLARAGKAGKAIYLSVGEHETAQLRGGVTAFATTLRSALPSGGPRQPGRLASPRGALRQALGALRLPGSGARGAPSRGGRDIRRRGQACGGA
jgi:predicted alpha/beta superfamily hydrolase